MKNKDELLQLLQMTQGLLNSLPKLIDEVDDPNVREAMTVVGAIAMNSISIQRLSLLDMAEALQGHVENKNVHLGVKKI